LEATSTPTIENGVTLNERTANRGRDAELNRRHNAAKALATDGGTVQKPTRIGISDLYSPFLLTLADDIAW
jgi:hypothetical protein